MPRTITSTHQQRDPVTEREKKEQRRIKNDFVGEPGLPSTDGDAAVSDSFEEIIPENRDEPTGGTPS
jgi:hypothetical protein